MRRLLFLCVLLLVFSPLTAAADTFSLWEKFPQTNPDNYPGFSVGAWDPDTSTHTSLMYIEDYFFARSSTEWPVIARIDSTWIGMMPSASEYAVLTYTPNAPSILNVSGEFWASVVGLGSGTMQVIIGTVTNNNPSYLWDRFLKDDELCLFDLPNIYVSPEISLFFACTFNSQGDFTGTGLRGTINATAVPLPGTLLLLGSGLLGLAGWGRRLRKS